MIPAPLASTNATPAPWQLDPVGAIAAAERILAKPRPSRSSYSRGEFGEDCYQLAVHEWEILQRKAARLQRLAQAELAAEVN